MASLDTILAWTALGLMVQMNFVWLIANRLNFLSAVDLFWSLGIGVGASILFALSKYVTVGGVLTTCLYVFWSLRLSSHLFARLKQHFPVEDSRYEKLKSGWKKGWLFLFFQFQALIQFVLLYPLATILAEPSFRLASWEVIGLLISVSALIGEAVADWQLKKFKALEGGASSARVCDQGLWKFSRHPNYFFEWLFWCGISLISVAYSHGIYSLLAPLMMYFLLIHVTGVKPSEERSLQSKGVAYESYQRRTNRFIPWLPRS